MWFSAWHFWRLVNVSHAEKYKTYVWSKLNAVSKHLWKMVDSNFFFFLQLFHMETSLNLDIINLFILGYKNEWIFQEIHRIKLMLIAWSYYWIVLFYLHFLNYVRINNNDNNQFSTIISCNFQHTFSAIVLYGNHPKS